jgi:PAS domain S-box-containing protein
MNTPLRVLHLEDSRLDAELIQSTLRAGSPDYEVTHAKNREEFETVLGRDRFDVILCDYVLPGYDGLSALEFARKAAPDVPFILLSGTLGEELAVECLKTGATDYILKQRLNRLVPSVRRAVAEAAERAERKRAQAALEMVRRHNELILQSTAEGVFGLDLNGRATFVNPSAAKTLGYRVEELIGQPVHALLRHSRPAGSGCQEDNCPILAAYQRGVAHQGEDEVFSRKDGTRFPAACVSSPIWSEHKELLGAVVTFRDITARKQAEADLKQAHQELLKASRLAGRAEVATGVLHNVGNVLNSVNVSAALVTDHLKKSKAAKLVKVVALLREHAPDLGAFLASDPKGKQVAPYLEQLAQHFVDEEQLILKELELLRTNVEHIKEIVAMQQNYATVSGIAESVHLSELVEDALRINEADLPRRQVQVVREFEPAPPVSVDKHKVLQVLINLLRNAKYACDDLDRPDKQIVVRIAHDQNRVKTSVIDNGVGIPAENLTRIFAHGFTTRKGGHGFGLHSAALAAREMGGCLIAQSEGLGRGSTFTLELPLTQQGRNVTSATGTPQLAA